MDQVELWAAVDKALENGNIDRIYSLLKSNAELILDEQYQWLSWTVHRQNERLVKLLLTMGCDVNAESRFGDFPLDGAVNVESPAMVRLLLEHGANPNQGRTAIGAIVGDKNSLEMVKLLEEYGADLHEVFTNELTGEPMNALSTAIDWGKEDVAEYLRSKGAVLPAGLLEQRTASQVPQTLDDEIVAYFTEHIGPVQRQSLIEIVPTEPPIAVHVIPATDETKCVTLFTTGMSALPMNVPEGEEDYMFAELFIQLPADWKYRQIEDPNYGWPVHWLRSLAKQSHQHGTWLGGPAVIVANEDPPQPLAPNTKLTCLLLMAEKDFTSSDGRFIRLYRLVPLHTQERGLELSKGIGALMRALDDHDVPFVVDLNRSNVATSWET